MPPEPAQAAPSRIGRILSLGALTAGLNSLGTSLIFGLLVMLNFDIAARAVFDHPVRGVPELVALSFVAIVFLQLPHALRMGRLTVADSLFSQLAARLPRAAHALMALYNAIGAALFALVVYASWPLFLRAWSRDLFIGTQGSFTAPTWPVKLVIVVGAAVMILQFLALAVAEARAAFLPADNAP